MRTLDRVLKIGFIFSVIILFGACEKHVTPNKVKHKLEKDTWRMSSFSFQGASGLDEFQGDVYTFEESGVVSVRMGTGVSTSGKWSVSIDKKPTTLNFFVFFDQPHFKLNDDWNVLTVSNKRIELESDNGTYTNKLSFTRIE